jgi:hypothetical protein
MIRTIGTGEATVAVNVEWPNRARPDRIEFLIRALEGGTKTSWNVRLHVLGPQMPLRPPLPHESRFYMSISPD